MLHHQATDKTKKQSSENNPKKMNDWTHYKRFQNFTTLVIRHEKRAYSIHEEKSLNKNV